MVRLLIISGQSVCIDNINCDSCRKIFNKSYCIGYEKEEWRINSRNNKETKAVVLRKWLSC